MLTTNELRIGNWVDEAGQRKQVLAIMKGYVATDMIRGEPLFTGIGVYEGIALTPEILKQIGFTKEDDHYFWQPHHENIHYRLYPIKEAGYVLSKGFINYNHELCIVRHLHTLQNIIISLTEQELEIELPIKKN
jgi:hypothetical protein